MTGNHVVVQQARSCGQTPLGQPRPTWSDPQGSFDENAW